MLPSCKQNIWMGLVLLVFTGCQFPHPQSIESYYNGYQAKVKSTVPLIRDEDQKGDWKTFDLTLNFQSRHAADQLKIDGTIKLGLHYELASDRILSLDTYLFFLDTNRKVQKAAFLSRALHFKPEEILTFSKNLAVPAGTEMIAFGYEGIARSSGDGADGMSGRGIGSREYFSDLPLKVKL